ncbi:MAG: glutathione S-transferase family protein [Alphaproteobacteria bacterium]|nr:glutathione S-transferase family protein [Alphaproteobacteria bacterium]
MIDLYFWPTPNGYKISIFLEEAGMPYKVIPVDIGAGDQFKPEFLKISPNNRMPAIVDHDGPGGKPISVFESGAILMYLAEKTGKFWLKEPAARWRTVEWVMFQMGGIGPMFGQNGHFRNYAPEKIPYALDRYSNETKRLYGVVDRQLKDNAFVAGDYSIADMAIWPWMRMPDRHGVEIDDFPNVKRWRAAIDARPAVKKAVAILEDRRRTGPIDEKTRENMFGATQYQRR